MFINSIIEFIRTGRGAVHPQWNILLFAALIILIFIINVLKRLNPGISNSRVVWFVMLVFLPAVILSGEQLIDYMLMSAGVDLSFYTKKISYMFLWLAGGKLVADAINIFIWNGIARKNSDEPVPKILTNFVSGVIYLFVVYFIMTLVFDLQVTGLVVSSGIIAGVIALSMQSILSDLIAGIAIAIEKPYRIGDWIEFGDGTLGEVVDINWRTTRLLSWRNSIYVVPNGKATAATLHNFNMPDKKYRRLFYVTISPDVPPETARRILLESALSCNAVIKDPPPVVRLVDIEKKPYRYMVSATYADYPSFASGRDQLMINIWTNFSKTGLESSCETSEVHFARREKPIISDPGVSELLGGITLFASLSGSELEKLASGAEIHLYRAGEYIAKEGSPDTSLLLVTAGVVSVSHRSGNGSVIELTRFGLGDSLGESSLLTGEPRNSDISAVTDCQIVEISKELMEEIIRKRPELLEELAAVMARRRLEHDTVLNGYQRKSTSELLSTYAIEMIQNMKSFFRI